MTSRTRFLITAAFVCHLLLAPSLVTSQLLSAASPPNSSSGSPNSASALQYQDVAWSAVTQEMDGPMVKLHEKAEIHYGTYILYGDEITYNRDTGDSTVDGHVVLDGGPNNEHIKASHGTYNVRSESGRFEIVTGTTGLRLKASRLVLTSSNPFAFTGKVVVKTGPDHYLVYDGTITTCELPRPKWQFYARKVDVEVGGNARIYRSTFRLEGVPVLFFPFATHPVQKRPRQSGFLIPNVGHSSIKGYTFGESVFWAINPSMDALLGAQYFSKRGWAPEGEFRTQPGESSFVDLNFFSVLDRYQGAKYQGGADVRMTAEGNFAHNLRGVANIDYLSSYVFRLAFTDVFTQAVNSEVNSTAYLSNSTHGFFSNASMQRYQDYEGTTNGNVISILHAPSFSSSGVDHAIAHSPFYWSYDAALDGLERSDPSFSTGGVVERFDLNPSLSLPIQIHGWSFRPELSLRDTIYTKQLATSTTAGGIEVESATSDGINRKVLEGSVEVRPPSLDRVFDREFLGRKWKHVIEPRVVYNYVTGVNNFANILRFDERDILSDTNEVEYSVVNRLYSKRATEQDDDCSPAGMPTLLVGGAPPQNRIPWQRYEPTENTPCRTQPQIREVVRWELAQKYFIDPTFGGLVVSGQPNVFVFASTIDLTGIPFLTEARRISPLISRLRVQTSNRTDVEWDLDYDFKLGRVNNSTALLNYRIGAFTLGGGNAFLHVLSEALPSNPTPAPSFNQFRAVLGYGQLNKRGLSAATNLGFDGGLGSLQYSSAQASYNWDCCGINIEYRRFNLGSVRDENQFRFTFALANIGAFGNLKRQERLF